MPKKGDKKPKPIVGNPADPRGMARYRDAYLTWMRTTNYSARTVENREVYLNFFIQWAEERGITRPNEVTKPILERYQRHLYHFRKPDGKPLSFRSQHSRLVPIRAFFKWLAKNNHILYNPAGELDLPKLEHRLPKHVLSLSEVNEVMNQPNIEKDVGIRDRAILETLFSTGMRRMELIRLKLYDVDVDRATVMIRQGKGRKDRMIPIGARAISWIDKYMYEVRPSFVSEPDEGTMFLTEYSEPFSPNSLSQLARKYVDAADIGKRGACHLFRHTMATLMLEGGADTRFIQQMLGHVKLETTQIYTQVSIKKLQEIFMMTHPGAKNERSRQADR